MKQVTAIFGGHQLVLVRESQIVERVVIVITKEEQGNLTVA